MFSAQQVAPAAHVHVDDSNAMFFVRSGVCGAVPLLPLVAATS